jgi:hypothetical protein
MQSADRGLTGAHFPDARWTLFPRCLLFKQAIKCGSRIARIARRRDDAAIVRSKRRARRQCVPRHGHSRREELAGIRLVLQGNTDRNRLEALKARGRIEVYALFAAMQRYAAFRTDALEIDIRRQGHRAAKTARGNEILDQPGQLGSGCVIGRFRALLLWPIRPGRARPTV